MKYKIKILNLNNQGKSKIISGELQFRSFDTYEKAFGALKSQCERWNDFKSLDEKYIYFKVYGKYDSGNVPLYECI